MKLKSEWKHFKSLMRPQCNRNDEEAVLQNGQLHLHHCSGQFGRFMISFAEMRCCKSIRPDCLLGETHLIVWYSFYFRKRRAFHLNHDCYTLNIFLE